MSRPHARTSFLILSLCITAEAMAAGPERSRSEATWPGLTRSGTVLLPNGWSLRPAGQQTRLGDFPVLMAEHPSEPVLAILHAGYGEHEVITLDTKTHKVIARVAIPESFYGLTWSRDGKRLYAGGGFDDVIYRFDHDAGLLSHRFKLTYPKRDPDANRVPAGLAIADDGKTLWVANAFGHSLARFDTEGPLLGELPLEKDSYPYALAWDQERGRLYVSLWNRAEVAVVDTAKNEVVARWKTEEHPNELLLTKKGKVLYVANANRNTVSVIDVEKGSALETIGTAIDPKAPTGCTPSALSLSADESVLFVANANTNDVAVVNVSEPGSSAPLGFIPAGWHPTCVRVSHDGKSLFVSNGKGTASKANREGPNPLARGRDNTREYIAGLFQGTLSTLPMPTPKQMADYSKTVYECSPLRKGDPTAVRDPAQDKGNPIPAKVGDPSPIKYCVYIIKENRTYDQVFGDLPEGNGEPSLCLFPESVTPNHHALVREFVLLDNFYVDGEVSADGHEWTMGAYATDYVEKTWPLMYRGNRRVPYPAEGALAIARPAGGYLWDKAAEKGVSYRSYGEFIKNGKTPSDPATTDVKSLAGHFDPKFRSYDLDYPDAKRADRFLEELAAFEKAGDMPRLVVMRLPNDHTSGTAVGKPTVIAYVGDNDLALGRVVEGLTKSRFWKEMAIFVIEDDAQNGSDHVDAHRTVALAISPYIKRHSVDSTMYSTSSMLRTMELCLGLEPMSQFDAAARPMVNAFSAKADLSPFTHRPARVDLKAKNDRTAWGAEKSQKLNLAVEDQADDLVFNEIIWKAVKGAGSPMPPPVRAAFVLPRPRAERDDDDD
ncbi:MAG: bifunctional YncE family protein/alkaline phosphatase family protein [Isosphaeraceae bacterium]|nr:bifunctional YncE family protein/alkaline phosphatase family protein [Isosphaeraceae bacterium]